MAYNYLGDYMSFIYLFLIGILIGTAMIIPGVSGAVIAVIFGVYDKLIASLTNLFKDFKKNMLFLSVLGSGILVGAVWFSNIMMFLYEKCEVATKLSFIGLILGGVPFLIGEVRKNKEEKINIKILFITLLFSLTLWYFSKNLINLTINFNNSSKVINFLLLFLAGFIYSVGKVIPGISSSFLLIIIGMYEFVLSVMANPVNALITSFDKILPFILGLIFGVIVLLKLMNFLLDKKFGLTYSIIIGFVIGSIPALIPKFDFNLEFITGIIVMIVSFVLSYKLTK